MDYSVLAPVALVAAASAIPVREIGTRISRIAAALTVLLFVVLVLGRVANDLVFLTKGAELWDESVQAIAGAWLHGQPLYPRPSDGLFYGLLYGPFLYEILALTERCLGIGSSAVALPATLAEVAAIALTWRACRQAGVSVRSAWLGAGAMLAALCAYYPYNGTRADPFLVLLAALALGTLPALERGSRTAPVVLGLCCGLSAALKFTAVSCASPALLCALLWSGTPNRSAMALRAGLGLIVGIVAPFLVPGAAFPAYLRFLLELHPVHISVSQLGVSVLFVTGWFLPIVAYHRGLPDARDYRLLFATTVALLPVLIVAATEGTGFWHFLPFLPPLAFLVARVVAETRLRNHVQLTVLMVLMAMATTGLSNQVTWIRHTLASAPQREAIRAALASFVAAHTGATIAIAPSNNRTSESLQTAVASLLSMGQPLIFTRYAWLDIHSQKNAEFFIKQQLDSCPNKTYWLTFAREPYTAAGARVRLFDDSGNTEIAFNSQYVQVGSTSAFDIWACKNAVTLAR